MPKISADLLYANPPYNSRQYLPNYHILETISRYDYPEIHGITGMRNYENQKSEFCSKSSVESAFRRMIQNANVRYVVISYNTEGLLSKYKLSEICLEFAVKKTFHCHDINYRRYNNVGTKSHRATEQLYFFSRYNKPKSTQTWLKSNPRAFERYFRMTYSKSPLNYIGDKFKILPAITKFFPQNINIMYDLFAGGCDVCTNVTTNKIYANNINYFVIEIYKTFQQMDTDSLLNAIDSIIETPPTLQ